MSFGALFNPNAAAGYAIGMTPVQGIFAGASSLALSFASAPASGDLVLALVGYSGSAAVSGVASTGATWALAQADAGSAHSEIWYSTNVTTTTVTVTVGSAATGGFELLHFKGNLAASPVDVTNGTGGFSTSVAPGSVTPGASGELVVYSAAAGSAFTATPAGYTTQAAQLDGSISSQTGYQIQGAATATNPTSTIGSTAVWDAVVAAFKHA